MLTTLLTLFVLFVLPLFELERRQHYGLGIALLLAGLLLSHSITCMLIMLALIASFVFCFFERHYPLITRFLWPIAKKGMPRINAMEKDALKAGEKSLESIFFAPSAQQISEAKKTLKRVDNSLDLHSQAFLDGPVQEVIDLCDDFSINHIDYDLPEVVWNKLRDEKFFGLVIDKKYGGLGFNQQAHAQILNKLASRSLTLASIVAVPNSLGPGELITHYGTEEQKKRYLKPLALGKEIPCFGLTSTKAGSDAQSIEDYALVVRYKDKSGKDCIGLKVSFSKRYITLAPIATLIGLAVKVYDKERILFDQEDVGITLLLIPASTPGIVQGQRHYPGSLTFLNGPIEGSDIVVPIDCILGGPKRAGQGWSMLVECLTCGRAISLPSAAMGSAWSGLSEAVLYSELRQQFSRPIGQFEAVQERLFEGLMWASSLDHMRLATISLIDSGQKPGVLSGAVKYFSTEKARTIACHVIDVMAGKAVMMGPKNTVLAGYHGSPVGITVEGANILTRGLMVFGQGVLRSHPYLGNIAVTIEQDTSDQFSKNVWEYVTSSYLNVLTMIASSWKCLFNRKDSERLLAMSTRFRFLCDLLIGYYMATIKKKGQISGMMADLLSIQACYLSTLSREKNEEHQKVLLDFLAYQFTTTERALEQRLPCLIKYTYKFCCLFAPLPTQYPVSRMKPSIDRYINGLLDIESPSSVLRDIDRHHVNIYQYADALRLSMSLRTHLATYLNVKASRPYLTFEEIAKEQKWPNDVQENLKKYLDAIEVICAVDVFDDLKQKSTVVSLPASLEEPALKSAKERKVVKKKEQGGKGQ